MTTAPAAGTQRPRGAARLVLRTTVPVALSAVLLTLVGALVGGAPAAFGALAGECSCCSCSARARWSSTSSPPLRVHPCSS
ncbi:hypothetical protein [Nocardioides zeae]